MEAVVRLQMADIVDAPRREVVDDEDLVATTEELFGEVRTDETGAARDQITHGTPGLIVWLLSSTSAFKDHQIVWMTD
jgi:hypothetical protein